MSYTRAQLVAEARQAGFSWANERLVTDWSAKGLLDRPARASGGRGAGSGARYAYSEEQYKLFLALLTKRSEVSTIPPLCNVPVFLWIYYGEKYAPVRQVRRALATAFRADRYGAQRSFERSRRTAQEIVKPIAHPKAAKTDVTPLIEALTGVIYRGDANESNATVLCRLLDPVVRPGKFAEHQAWRVAAAQGVITNAVARALAISKLSEIPDEIFELARVAQLSTIISYATDWRALAGSPDIGHFITEEPTLDFMANNACGHLLTGLGLLLLGRRPALLPPGKHVATVRTASGEAEAELTVTIDPAPVSEPDGRRRESTDRGYL